MINRNCLIISDLDWVTKAIEELLLKESFNVYTAKDGSSGITIAKKIPIQLVITGMIMPGLKGDEIIKGIKGIDKDTVVWVITEEKNFDLDFVIEAMKLGADDYFVVFKDLPMDKMRKSLQSFIERMELKRRNEELQKMVESKESEDEIQGNCDKLRSVVSIIRKVAPTDVSVLVTGESGTGKELAAKAIWKNSNRRDKIFIPINCGAIPENLLESELFGHEKGAFTGAYASKVGKLELANGGTIFLDEIGDMPHKLQVKLLRFLQEGEIERIGGSKPIRLDVRVISATNKDLEEEVKEGNFREDLFYRLNVIHINMPPLRERGNDILLLANFFLRTLAQKEGRIMKGFSPLALSRMKEYKWPGNIRELKHKIHRAIILSSGEYITAEDLGFFSSENRLTLKEAKKQFEMNFIMDALMMSKGNISKAARSLGIARQQLQRYIKKYGINVEAYKN